MSINHPPGEDNANIPILNACLSYITHLMINKDRNSVQEAVCGKFNVQTIKSAYEALYCVTNPGENFSYRGPNKASMREKASHAFNEIYKSLQKLDSQNKMPTIACPSEELHTLLPGNGQFEFQAFEMRLRSMENEMSRLKTLEKTVSELKSAHAVQNKNPSFPALLPNNHQSRERSRLHSIKSSSSRVSHPSPKRTRVESDTSAVSSDDEAPFQIPKYNKRKALQREKQVNSSNGVTSFSDMLKSAINKDTNKPAMKRRPAVWGKSETTASRSLKSAVSDIFMFNCSTEMNEQLIATNLQSCNIDVKKVKMMSHAEAARRSFKISVSSYEDYDKLMSGEILPRGIAVRKFIYPRRDVDTDVNKFMQHSEAELNALSNRNPPSDNTTMDISVIPSSTDATVSSVPTTSINNHE